MTVWTHEQMAAYAIKKQRQRQQWLYREHQRRPRCHYCHNLTIYAPERCSLPGDHDEEFIATLDHFVPRSRGGADAPSNWVLACLCCNKLKGDMKAQSFIRELQRAGVR